MTNNSEGLSPTLRPQLGVGWNRALPAPFGFGNAIYPDGINDYLSIPAFSGKTFGEVSPFVFEFWFNGPISLNNRRLYGIDFTTGEYTESRHSSSFYIQVGSFNNIYVSGGQVLSTAGKSLLSFPLGIAGNVYRNGEIISSVGGGNIPDEKIISQFSILKGTGSSSPWANEVAEFRIYNRNISKSEARLNYNSGIGENPSKTEELTVWYKFDKFEELDFSLLQDNSDIRLGIRDLSSNNNHAQALNMDTNPASPNYVLKPF